MIGLIAWIRKRRTENEVQVTRAVALRVANDEGWRRAISGGKRLIILTRVSNYCAWHNNLKVALYVAHPEHPVRSLQNVSVARLSNVKVIPRTDSSIVPIFDQFSRVCVRVAPYGKGDEWEKTGYEGSRFSHERLAEARAKLPLSKQEGPASKFAPEFVVLDLDRLQDDEKGRSQTVGLWCFEHASRCVELSTRYNQEAPPALAP
ncbi:hypothetical protein DFH29DRAFT_880213 [Suillus ampliporus]|nr:hypothetical protein DFH29DRAFT_880213 [Suillus ampliporus]